VSKQLRIRVACPECGVLFVTAIDLTLRLCVDNRHWSYCFRCRGCGRATAREVDESTVAPLVSVGVPVQEWYFPAELAEARPRGAVLVPDDMLDFHLLLHRADWFADVRPTDPGWKTTP
jgi:hypothetical protein